VPAVDSANVEAQVFAKLNAWGFTPGHNIGVAYSGGGDSTALLALMLKWSDSGHVYAFIVDHALRSGSDKEAKLAEKRALAMGAQTKILTCQWPEGIPTTGIQEKARNARYQLLGDACREQGIENLFLGHNHDDQAETVLMRQGAGSGWRGLAGIKCRNTAPIWPALQGVTILRPMLDCGREELRLYNKNNGLPWIDDPSNENRSFARIRARDYLTKHPSERKNLLTISKAATEVLSAERQQILAFIRRAVKFYDWGGATLLPGFNTAGQGQIAEALKYLLPVISGEALPPGTEKRMNLARRIRAQDFSGATLGGVRLLPSKDGVLCVRDLGVLLGRKDVLAQSPLRLPPEQLQVWDGRFTVSTRQDDVVVDALGNWLEGLGESRKQLLATIPEPVRGGLPVFIRAGKIAYIPFVDFAANTHGFHARALASQRLQALLGE